jgi:peptide deformylase
MILPVITYPDKLLKERSEPIETFDAALHTFLDDMYETMIASNGIGLAAIQVARPLRVLIINLADDEGNQPKDELLEVINPVLVEADGTTFFQEGCLSVPGFYEDVERYETVTLRYQDRHGQEHTIEADGLLSVAIQHEMDHLDGKLFIEKLSYARRKKFEKEYKKLQKQKKKSA